MTQARPSCFMLLKQEMPCALVLALLRAGTSIPARMAMIAITTSSSIRVNPVVRRAHRQAEYLEECISRPLLLAIEWLGQGNGRIFWRAATFVTCSNIARPRPQPAHC